MNQQTITCINPSCQTLLKKTSSPYIKCGNCRTHFFSFCHQFPNSTNTYVRCSKCPNQLYYFFCNKCRDVMCFRNYKMGELSKCKCGFEGCYVVCENCNHQMCYPPGKKYQGLGWSCSKCEKPFSFMTCDECFKPLYSKKFKEEDKHRCENRRCKATLVVKKCVSCKGNYLDSRNNPFCGDCQKQTNNFGKLDLLIWKKLTENSQNTKPARQSPKKNHNNHRQKVVPKSPSLEKANEKTDSPLPKPHPRQRIQTLQAPERPKEIQKSFGRQIESLCKICLDKQAEFINIKCFHLSTCEKCSISMNKVCPICRTEGEFHKVYK